MVFAAIKFGKGKRGGVQARNASKGAQLPRCPRREVEADKKMMGQENKHGRCKVDIGSGSGRMAIQARCELAGQRGSQPTTVFRW
jgi:hypothetical protein